MSELTLQGNAAGGDGRQYPLGSDAARDVVALSCFWDAPSLAQNETAAKELLNRDGTLGDAVLVLGAFDGLHLGHRALVTGAVEDAKARGTVCIAVTFNPDPSEVLHPENPQEQLLAWDDRERGLLALGVDYPVTFSFTPEFAALSPDEFVERKLMGMARPVAVHVGSNFRFGARGSGDVALMRSLGKRHGFDVIEHPLVKMGHERVSSTRIRTELGKPGGLGEAKSLLGRCHFVRGVIEHGRGEGTSFGFPTANIRCAARMCMPCEGVYGGYVIIDDVAWPAAINVGAPPSFSAPDDHFLEANLIGFTGDVYGRQACVTFVEWLRPSRRFSSLEELERVVLGNIDWVRINLGEGGVRLS